MQKRITAILFSAAMFVCSLTVSGCSSDNNPIDNDSSHEDDMPPWYAEPLDPKLNGVYYCVHTEKAFSGRRRATYFVEFFSDGTITWWDYPEYQDPTYYIGTYIYSEVRESFIVEVENHLTCAVTQDDYGLIFLGGKFNNEYFWRSSYDNIIDAVVNKNEVESLYSSYPY